MTAAAPLPPTPAPRKARRWLRALIVALAAAVLLPSLLVGAALLWITSAAGNEFIRGKAEQGARAALRGDVRVEKLGFTLSGLSLHGVSLAPPDGASEPALRIESLEIQWQLAPLLGKRVYVKRIHVRGPRLDIAAFPDGTTTLSRALAPNKPRSPAPPPVPGKPFTGLSLPWAVELGDLTIEGVDVKVRPAPGAPPATHVRDVSVHLSARAGGADAALVALASAKVWKDRPAEQGGPLELPLGMDLKTTLHGALAKLEKLVVTVGAMDLSAEGEVDVARKVGALRLSVNVPRTQIEKLAPKAEVVADVALTGEVKLDGAKAVADLVLAAADAAAGKITVRAEGGLEGPVRPLQAEVKLVALDGSRWASKAPPTAIDLGLVATGTQGPGPKDLSADVRLDIDRLELRGVELADGDAVAHYDLATQVAELKSFGLSVPGARIEASGRYAPAGLAGDLRFSARDLRLLAGSALRALGRPSPAVGGAIDLSAHVEGRPGALVARARLASPRLVSGKNVIEGLALRVDLGGLPARPAGQIQLAARELRAGANRISDLDLAARLEKLAAKAELDATVHLPQPTAKEGEPLPAPRSGRLHLGIDGELSEKRDMLALAALELSYPENTWKLQSPTRVSFGGGKVAIEPLVLAGPGGRIAVSGRRDPRVFDLTLAIAELDLARLPSFALPPKAALAGKVDLDAHVAGSARAPSIDARLGLTDVSAFGNRGIGMNASARVFGGRVKADATIEQAGVAKIALSADAPLDVKKAAPSAPLAARIRVDPVDLARLPLPRKQDAESDPLRGLAGTVAFSLDASGTLANPKLALVVDARDLDLPARRLEDARMRVGVDLFGRDLRVNADAGLGPTPLFTVAASAPFDLLRAIHAPKELLAALRKEQIALDVKVPGLDLAALAERKLAPPGTRGWVALDARVRGTADAPQLSARFSARDVASGKISGAGAEVALDAGEDVRLTLAASLGAAGQVAAIDARVKASTAALATKKIAPADLPLDVKLTVPAKSLRALASAAGRRAPQADGALWGTMTVGGTLAHPVVDAKFALRDLSAFGKPVGEADFTLGYRSGAAKSAVEIRSVTGGKLALQAGTSLPIEPLLPGPMKRLLPAEIPLDVAFSADHFDLGFAAGMVPSLRALAGKLEADVKVTGTAGAPSPSGFFRLQNGRVAVRGLGDFEDVLLDLAFSDGAAELRRLGIRQGKGTVIARARAELKGERAFQAQLQTKDFRVAVGDTAATVGFDLDVKGKAAPKKIEADVRLANTLIVLPQAPPRTAQSLARHPEVVLASEAEARSDAASDAGPPTVVKVHLVIPGDLRVRSSLLDLRAGADVTAVKSGKELRVEGGARVEEGWVSALSRRFTFQHGKVDFTGGPPGAAKIDVRALHEVAGYKVFVVVTGTGENRTVSLLSEPPLKEEEIAFVIATGSPVPKAGAGGDVALEGAGLSVGLSAVTEVLRNKLADALPLDVLSIEGADISNLRLKTGVYLSQQLYVGTQVQPGASDRQNMVEFRAEYDVSDNVTVQGTGGEVKSGVDLIWSKDF